MKKLIIFAGLLLSLFNIQASCPNDTSYKNLGWVVSYPQNFELFSKYFMNQLERGIQSGEYVKDLKGVIATSESKIENRLYMDVTTWDNLSTGPNEAYGDFAVFRNNNDLNQILEIRWFNYGERYVAVNSKLMNCVSIIPPTAQNTIL